jgi:hypothetical protein
MMGTVHSAAIVKRQAERRMRFKQERSEMVAEFKQGAERLGRPDKDAIQGSVEIEARLRRKLTVRWP